ncbi:MAG: DNA-binding domain-containing protein [Salibacteraceae bacterium]
MLKVETHKIQSAIAEYTRTGEIKNIEGANSERLPHYRRLVFNVIFDTLTTAYPITRKLLGAKWKGVVDRFFANHNCQNHQVWRMPFEFFEYFSKNETDLIAEHHYICDLLFFEWVEIEVYSEKDMQLPGFNLNGQWTNGAIALNPHHRIVELNYPVFTKDYSNMNQQKGTYYLLVVRNLNTYKVQFLKLSPLFVMAIQNLESYNYNFLLSLKEVIATIETMPEAELIKKANSTVLTLFEKGLFLGYLTT